MAATPPQWPWSVLGCAPYPPASDLKAAYRTRALKLHPDVNPSPDAMRKFKVIWNNRSSVHSLWELAYQQCRMRVRRLL